MPKTLIAAGVYVAAQSTAMIAVYRSRKRRRRELEAEEGAHQRWQPKPGQDLSKLP